LEWLIAHRNEREAQILNALSSSWLSINQIVLRVYKDIPDNLRPAAARNVLAHLIDLWERSLIEADPELQRDALFRLR
jgi:hydroxyacylglutathione hydrolase